MEQQPRAAKEAAKVRIPKVALSLATIAARTDTCHENAPRRRRIAAKAQAPAKAPARARVR